MRKKITIIGSGFVGSTTTLLIAERGLADIVLLDIDEGIAKGKALDLFEAMPLEGKDIKIIGTSNYAEIKNSNIIIITAGLSRKPNMTRDDLFKINAKIVEDVCLNIKKYSPEAILIVVTNPLDVMAYKAFKTTGFPKERVLGLSGVLDSSRFKAFITQETGFSVKDINTLVIGGHDKTMIPLKRYATIAGIPLSYFLSEEKINQLIERTKKAGDEIVGFLKTGSAYFAPARAILEMVEAIVYDQKRILPCSVLCSGEYKAKDIFIGVPVVVGSNGIEKIIEVSLDAKEEVLMKKSVEHIKNLLANL